MPDPITTRHGQDGSDRLLAACYDELKSTRAMLTTSQKKNSELEIRLDKALERCEKVGAGAQIGRKLERFFKRVLG